MSSVSVFVAAFNSKYEKLHRAYEENFWATKMALKGASRQQETATKAALDDFLGDEKALEQVKQFLASAQLSPAEKSTLQCFQKTLETYITPASLRSDKIKIDELEAELQEHRGQLVMGLQRDGNFVKMTSTQLRNILRTSQNEGERKQAYEQAYGIGAHVAPRFCEIVKKRNAFAKARGFEDFYDMKVQQAEGLTKRKLFEILDDLEQKSKPIMVQSLERLARLKGPSALLPWNLSIAQTAPNPFLVSSNAYFPFENAVDVWARSFAALSITYKNAVMQLDLCEREGKYPNGFCHWPQVAWKDGNGNWVPSQANFTSLADPSAVGSGHTALTTLMHEGGHAAHFANVVQTSPLFAQERAPTSVAYAENQSMFLDSLVGDADWMARYALDKNGSPIPWALIEERIKEEHPYKVQLLRGMLAVPYFEKALYELPEDKVTPETILALADKIEREIQGGLSPRPLFSVPHILADESSCYYHGYVLAEMSVHQTRAHFLSKYGRIVDNPQVGKDLAEVYWRPGNSEPFLTLVEKLTGAPLGPQAWINELQETVEDLLASEKKAYDEAIQAGPKYKVGDNVDLDMTVRFVHGDLVVADSLKQGSLLEACKVFKTWVASL
ncbi:hypothetical protein HDV03_004682 [Kappamyces sp. JEL0829]|nr:hypothetical protein HDV03_004682 [Kappamyces sp. JEL0829]